MRQLSSKQIDWCVIPTDTVTLPFSTAFRPYVGLTTLLHIVNWGVFAGVKAAGY